MPSYIIDEDKRWAERVYDRRRFRNAGICSNLCSGHGSCEKNNQCKCFTGLNGEPEWVGGDCSQRACPYDFAWVGEVVGANNLHPWTECSNKGICNRETGMCECFYGYDGIACQRTSCPENCNYRGACWPEKVLADRAGRVYDLPWDAKKQVGCVCDYGFRGPACELQECPSGPDPLNGFGNEAGRDCSGRGICNYDTGLCQCFKGFLGDSCEKQFTLF